MSSPSATLVRPVPASQALSLAPMTPPQAWRFAEWLAGTPLLPDAYHRRPASVFWALEYGRALNLDVVTTICSIHVIKGKPTQSADLMLSRARNAGHRVRITPERTRCVVKIVRVDDPEDETVIEWTLDDAVTACLCELRNGRPYARDEKGRPTSWEKYPRAMLRSRAIAEAVRTACPEVLHGAIYTPEELGAVVDVDGNPITVIPGVVEQTGTEKPTAPRVIRAAHAEAGDWAVPDRDPAEPGGPPDSAPWDAAPAETAPTVSPGPQALAGQAAESKNQGAWRRVWDEARGAGALDAIVRAPDTGALESLRLYLTRRGAELHDAAAKPAATPSPTNTTAPPTLPEAAGPSAPAPAAGPERTKAQSEEIAVALAEMLDAATGINPHELGRMFVEAYGHPPESATAAELRQMRDVLLGAS
ncbi:recombinase RecT (plasmid) [Streptomycetaceae bacterium NBC_01309]